MELTLDTLLIHILLLPKKPKYYTQNVLSVGERVQSVVGERVQSMVGERVQSVVGERVQSVVGERVQSESVKARYTSSTFPVEK